MNLLKESLVDELAYGMQFDCCKPEVFLRPSRETGVDYLCPHFVESVLWTECPLEILAILKKFYSISYIRNLLFSST